MATANHFLLDIVGGVIVAALAAIFVYRRALVDRLRRTPPHAPAA